MSQRTEVEEFILKEFYSGKSVNSLVRDWLLIHEGNKKTAERLIYRVLAEHANDY